MTIPSPSRSWIRPLLLIGAVVLIVAACSGASTGPSGAAAPTSATPIPTPLRPAPLTGDPIGILAWAFTPIFQVLFIILIAFYRVTGDIGIAIVLLTIVIRIPLIPLFRSQTVSQKRMQLLQPELREIAKRYKGDRNKISQMQQALYKERGVNPLSGCLPLLLQLPLLFIMYQVIRDGLTNYDVTPMLTVFGQKVVDITCPTIPSAEPCIRTTVAWLGGLDVGKPHVDWLIPLVVFDFPVSIIAIVSAVLQVFQSRMTLPALDPANPDPNARITRQTMLFLPLIFVFYAALLPAGLYIYYIASTIISIIQQYLIVGWGSSFPLFGWDPAFARNHTPRFPVATPAPIESTRAAGAPARPTAQDRAANAASTVRPRERGRPGRQGRRGRRR
ncbi:MAG TPA: membrane protein insertase YidC [Candidatus Limnocylindria bacterium]|nr:membrane protein insertase YidC [Candidatus Limnocylindria bacterium]